MMIKKQESDYKNNDGNSNFLFKLSSLVKFYSFTGNQTTPSLSNFNSVSENPYFIPSNALKIFFNF